MTITNTTRPSGTETSAYGDLPPLWWNPWMAFYCKWLKVFTAENDESAMRRYIRHPSDMPINFQVNESLSPVPHRLKDVSVGGLCFGSDKPLLKGTVIHIHIPVVLMPLSQEKQPVTAGAEPSAVGEKLLAVGEPSAEEYDEPSAEEYDEPSAEENRSSAEENKP